MPIEDFIDVDTNKDLEKFNENKIIAEIGINHNGDIELAKRLIDSAIVAGCDYAKFQKRTPDICVPEAQKSKLRETPWGTTRILITKRRSNLRKKNTINFMIM